MVNENLVKEIFETNFNISPTSITHIPDKGITYDVFIVDMPDGKFVIRISQEPNTSQFEKEKWEMEQANKLGIPTPKVIKVDIHNNIVYMIEDYVEGAHGTDESLDSLLLWTELGKYAKTIHSIPVEGFGGYMVLPGKFNEKRKDYLEYDIQSLNEEDILFKMGVLTIEQSKNIKETFEELKNKPLIFGLNHGDLSLKNVIVDNNKKVVLLDWGSSESHVIPHFDIVKVLQSSFKFDFKNKNFIAFLSGLGIAEEQFSELKPTIDALMLLRAVDHLRWGLDKKPDRVEHFKVVLSEVLRYMAI